MEIKNLIKEKVVFHCNTEEKANELLKKAHELGYRWCNEDSYLGDNCYKDYKEDTCYNIVGGSYGDCSFYEEEGYEIIEYILDRECELTLNDLETGMLVIFRNGKQGIVIRGIKDLHGQYKDVIVYISSKGFDYLGTWNKDLKNSESYEERDIVQVRLLISPGYSLSYKKIDFDNSKVVWERKEEVEEMTLEQVCKELGRKIKIVK